MYRLALNKAEGVFFQNQDDIRTFREAGILEPDARVLTARGTGVDVNRFAEMPFPALPPAGPADLSAGRPPLGSQRSAEYAAAARLLKARHPEARFQVLGPPEPGPGQRASGADQMREDEGSIEYLGDTRDVRPFMAAAAVLVLPSWREGTPTAIMEGMSMGRAAVVTDVPGCREVVREGFNGRLVPPRDPEALAAALETFIATPAAIVQMGAGRAQAGACGIRRRKSGGPDLAGHARARPRTSRGCTMISTYRMALLQALDIFCLLLALTITGVTTIAPDLSVFHDYTGASLFTIFFYMLFFYILGRLQRGPGRFQGNHGRVWWPVCWASFPRQRPLMPLITGALTAKPCCCSLCFHSASALAGAGCITAMRTG